MKDINAHVCEIYRRLLKMYEINGGVCIETNSWRLGGDFVNGDNAEELVNVT